MDFNDIDLNKLTINNKIIEYNGKRGLHIKTPRMRIPFGLDEEYGKYILKLEFSDFNNNDEMNNFYDFITNLEKIFKNSFGNAGEYKSLIRRSKTYDPVFCPKVMERYNRLECEVFDNDNLTTIYDVKKNSYVNVCLSFDRVWEMNKKNKLRNGYIVYVKKIICV
jgi:hypothetical protein